MVQIFSPRVVIFERVVLISGIALSSILFLPIFGLKLSLAAGLRWHLMSYVALGLLFEIPELSLGLVCLRMARSEDGLNKRFVLFKKILKVRYWLTHLIAPLTGIFTIASGLYLIDRGKYSLTEGWLFWMLTLSTIGLYKGINHHNLYIRAMFECLARSEDRVLQIRVLRKLINSPFDQALIFSELPTYLGNYCIGWFKFSKLFNPLLAFITYLESALPAKMYVGMLLVGAGSVLIVPLRLMIKKFSAIEKNRMFFMQPVGGV